MQVQIPNVGGVLPISIITVCRNDLPGLKQTFESVRSQESKAFEWWVVDGNSTDGTAAWLKENHTLPGGWISEPDQGVYDAMNKGIDLSCGDYLLFMNSGDQLAGPDVVAELALLINRPSPPDFVYGDALDFATDGTMYFRKARGTSHIKFGMPTRHQSMLYRRALLYQERYPVTYALSADYALTARCLMHDGVKVLKLDFPVCLFALGGQHDRHRREALKEDFLIRKNILHLNFITCASLFCLHWLHHYARNLCPALNQRLIYKTSK